MKTHLGNIFGGIIIAGLILSTGTAAAQTCEKGTTQEALQYLRRLSLDLRGRLPDAAELDAVAATGSVDPALIDQMIASDELVAQTRRMHRDLLWTNIVDNRISNNNWRLRGPGRAQGGYPVPAFFIASAGRATRWRGGYVACLDEPARFDPNTGAILTTVNPNDPNIHQEGWVEVAPYWNPSTTVRVCAFEAQANLTVPDAQGRPLDCVRNPNNVGCGCGPNLQWCQSNEGRTQLRILEAMNEQLLRYVDEIVRDDRPYTDVLLGKDMELNGPISHYLRFQTQTGGGDSIVSGPEQNHPIPEISFEQEDQWQKVTRGERHAGVLTMAGYLLKFQSDRGRANRFYNAFLCQHFESSNPLPPATDACHSEPDLTKRCGCKDCHIAVEPAAAFWGRWGEAGLLPLNEDNFPTYNSCCVEGGACSAQERRIYNANVCGRFYLTTRDVAGPDDPQNAFLGMLKAYVFADTVREQNITEGPEGIAHDAIDSGAFASCAVHNMWKTLMAREATTDEQATLDELQSGFARGYSMKSLIKDIVTRPEYVQAGRFEGEKGSTP